MYQLVRHCSYPWVLALPCFYLLYDCIIVSISYVCHFYISLSIVNQLVIVKYYTVNNVKMGGHAG